jgi:hypothetical protein
MTDVSYVLPLKWSDDQGLAELTGYLTWLTGQARVTVVDGSPPDVYARHAAAWAGLVEHLPPDPRWSFLNGKVNGVHTGVHRATADHVVIADDDVRYDADALRAIVTALDDAELVVPANVFRPMPWHARWDTSRTLLNRALGHDHPGTMAVRRSMFLAMGGYDGDVLFENLELLRTVRAAGGRVRHRPDIIVDRRPPTARHFRGQRVRQAYDSRAQPVRLLGELAILPAVAWAAARPSRRWPALAAPVALAEVGRRRDGGAARYPAGATLLAPLWLLERGVCSWVALSQYGRGVAYAGRRLRTAAHSVRALRRRGPAKAATGPIAATGSSPAPHRAGGSRRRTA